MRFGIDLSHNKYGILLHGNILKISFFAERKNTLKGFENNT